MHTPADSESPMVVDLHSAEEEGGAPPPSSATRTALQRLALGMLAMGAVGMACAVYLVVLHYSTKPSFCELGSRLSCEKVDRSAFAVLLGVPVSVLGAGWFGLLLLLEAELFLTPSLPMAVLVLAWLASGVAFVGYLVFAEIWIGAVCPLCTVVHVVTLASFWMATVAVRKFRVPLRPKELLRHLKIPLHVVGVALLLFVPPLVIFNFPLPSGSPPAPGVGQSGNVTVAELARCLEASGVELFASTTCPHCIDQKALFGPDVDLLKIHWCDKPAEAEQCTQAGIVAFPTWVKFRSRKELARLVGQRSLAELAEWAGCPF
eukprot:RCo036506